MALKKYWQVVEIAWAGVPHPEPKVQKFRLHQKHSGNVLRTEGLSYGSISGYGDKEAAKRRLEERSASNPMGVYVLALVAYEVE